MGCTLDLGGGNHLRQRRGGKTNYRGENRATPTMENGELPPNLVKTQAAFAEPADLQEVPFYSFLGIRSKKKPLVRRGDASVRCPPLRVEESGLVQKRKKLGQFFLDTTRRQRRGRHKLGRRTLKFFDDPQYAIDFPRRTTAPGGKTTRVGSNCWEGHKGGRVGNKETSVENV